MLYLIGLGLNEKGISLEGIEAIKKCKIVFLEDYTVEFSYSAEKLEKIIGKKVISANREFIENFDVLKDAKKSNIALLVYGSPLTATTHISLIQEAKKQKINYEIIYNASILDAVAETGLQLYKFGKITSMPAWQRDKNYQPDSFMDILKENRFINSHSLILIDIGLEFRKALFQLVFSAEKYDFSIDKMVVCSRLGTKDSRIFYGTIPELKGRKIDAPFCFIIPGEMHFFEKEILENFKN
ncbi:MAG: diphthine synthase [Candidatus Nanoarchaeia archaeon]|nr:diphthine synthase [Candidatus Nanoarchaeia archaeon]